MMIKFQFERFPVALLRQVLNMRFGLEFVTTAWVELPVFESRETPWILSASVYEAKPSSEIQI